MTLFKLRNSFTVLLRVDKDLFLTINFPTFQNIYNQLNTAILALFYLAMGSSGDQSLAD